MREEVIRANQDAHFRAHSQDALHLREGERVLVFPGLDLGFAADRMRLHARRFRQARLRPELVVGRQMNDGGMKRFIGHDPILSDISDIASVDLSDDGLYPFVHLVRMRDGPRIRAARKELGLTQAELGMRLGLPQSVISDWERGTLHSWSDHADKLAMALGKPKSYFSAPSVTVTATKGIPVVGEVEAGAFRFALEIPEQDRVILPIVALPGMNDVEQVALKVTGPSMDLLYPDGSYVIVVSADDTDVRDGDRVVVYRAQGELREATIKEVRVEEGRIGLYPRSSHADHQDPIFLDPQDQDGPEIAYVVIGQFRQEERPAPAVQWRKARK